MLQIIICSQKISYGSETLAKTKNGITSGPNPLYGSCRDGGITCEKHKINYKDLYNSYRIRMNEVRK